MLAEYFAVKITKIKTTLFRVMISAAIGAVFSCLHVLFEFGGISFAILFLASMLAATVLLSKGERAPRRFKLLILLLLNETVIGGAAFWMYSWLDGILLPHIQGVAGAENKKLLIAAAVVLLVICFMRLAVLAFSSVQSENAIFVEIEFSGKIIGFSALVDSGNLLTDPIGARPVIIVKSAQLAAILAPYGDEKAFESEDGKLYGRMRLIPASGAFGKNVILYGFIPDSLTVLKNGSKACVDAVVAVDFTKGDFAGFCAIAPAAFDKL
jgi:stage II sporulation protein GA (sporulation sigma-E factor processing peptidase)